MAEGVSSGAASAGSSKQASVRYGVYNTPGPFVGKSIREIRAMYKNQWNIADDAIAHKGKQPLDEDYKIAPNDSIDFVRSLGEKGV